MGALSSKEWDATVTIYILSPEIVLAQTASTTASHRHTRLADERLFAASIQLRHLFQAEDFNPQDIALTWRLNIVPARDPEGPPLGYSAVAVMDFSDLVERLSPERRSAASGSKWRSFQTEERANQFPRIHFAGRHGRTESLHRAWIC